MTTATKTVKAPTADKSESSIDKDIALMRRTKGASIEEIAKATGWLPHTTHSGLQT